MINVSKNKYVKPKVLKGELMRYLIFGFWRWVCYFCCKNCAVSVGRSLCRGAAAEDFPSSFPEPPQVQLSPGAVHQSFELSSSVFEPLPQNSLNSSEPRLAERHLIHLIISFSWQKEASAAQALRSQVSLQLCL